MIEDHRASLGLTPRKISDEEIAQRLVYTLVNEAARLLEEGIASQASDIDMVYLMGYGFPVWRGGPMNYANEVGLFNVVQAMHRFAQNPHVVQHAIARAGIEAAEVDDVLMGCAFPEGATGSNIARQIALRAGGPVTEPGITINRFCSSGLQTIALASQRVMAGEGDIFVAGGVESISCVQQEMNTHMLRDPELMKLKPEVYLNMLESAEIVAKRYGITRQAMDEFGAATHQKTTAALAAGWFTLEIAPITVTMGVADKVIGLTTRLVTVHQDEDIRPGTTCDSIKDLRSAVPGGLVTPGNASQFSDGAGAVVVMDEVVAQRKGLTPLGRFLSFGVAGCEPDEKGTGPVFAIPKVLAHLG